MNQQPLNLRRSIQIIRRYKILVALIVLVGVGGGVGYAVLNPPSKSSQALVVIARPRPNMATDMLVANSQPVLAGAVPEIGPGGSLADLTGSVSVRSVTPNVLSITVSAKSGGLAVKEANAVVNSFIAYIGSPNSPVGRVDAQVFVAASSASGTGATSTMVLNGVIGMIAGLAAGFAVALRVSRGDARLHERDAIAAAIGVPVLAAVPVTVPGDAAGWLKLVNDYKPSPVQAWRLRSILDHLGVTASGVNGSRVALTVASVATDRKASAVGPQLASFAASLGVPTGLLISPQDSASTATLRAAAAQPTSPHLKGGQLRIAVDSGGDVERQLNAKFTVVVTAIDIADKAADDTVGADTRPRGIRTPVVILAASAGTVTGDQLAQAAAAAADAGSVVAGIVVADPDPNDTTTGLITRPVGPRAARGAVPTKHGEIREVRTGDRTRPADWAARGGR